MPVGEQEHSFVSLVGNALEESPRLIEREELNRFGASGARSLML